MELVNIAGWNQTVDDWKRYIEIAPNGCFLAIFDGKPAGTATTINYRNKVAWIGMVLVHPDLRGKGVGGGLMKKCLEYLDEQKVTSIKLDATPMGKPVYVKLGFQDEYILNRWQVVTPKIDMPPESIVDLGGLPPDSLARYDLRGFGADRMELLESIQDTGKAYAFSEDENDLKGYIFVRPGSRAWYIGPWVADSNFAAEALLKKVLDELYGETVYMDALSNVNAENILNKYRFKYQRKLTRMFRGENKFPGKPEIIYAIAGPEVG